MDILDFIIFGIAVWRVSSLIVEEEGPFHMFRKIREATGIQHDESGAIWIVPDTFAAGLLSCIWCASVWVATAWVALWYVLPGPALFFSQIMALSGFAVIINTIVKKT